MGGHIRYVLLLRPPGVYRVDRDTALLTDVLRDRVRGRHVLDVGAGTGALAIAAAHAGAASVTAVDLSRRSAAAAWLNSRLHRVPITIGCGDLFTPVRGRRFDARVVARAVLPFGPVMRARAALLEARGMIVRGQRVEEIVVVAGHRR